MNYEHISEWKNSKWKKRAPRSRVNMTIEQILEDLDITNYTIHDDGSVTAHQDVILINSNLTKIPIKFRIIEGFFDCYLIGKQKCYKSTKKEEDLI